MTNYRVMIVDDHPLMREALRDAVDVDGFIIAGEAEDGLQALERVKTICPDLVLMDLFLPGMDGIDTMRKILDSQPDIKFIIITSSNQDEYVLRAIRAGAWGYITKDATREHILECMRQVSLGRRYIPAEISGKMAGTIFYENEMMQLLSAREIEILELIAVGSPTQKIAQKLVLSESTVRAHIFHILRKLDLKNRSQLVIFAQKFKEH
ncbi:MAG: response regulator transcription factor [Chloroflexota bacterium]